jgi:hypothetical protein
MFLGPLQSADLKSRVNVCVRAQVSVGPTAGPVPWAEPGRIFQPHLPFNKGEGRESRLPSRSGNLSLAPHPTGGLNN